MIGSCDNCGRNDVPVFNGVACGCETTQCYLCNGDIADPYGELEPQEFAERRAYAAGSALTDNERARWKLP